MNEETQAHNFTENFTLKPAASRGDRGGFVLFGRLPEKTLTFRGRPSDWLERWFKTAAAARTFANKRGWSVTERGIITPSPAGGPGGRIDRMQTYKLKTGIEVLA